MEWVVPSKVAYSTTTVEVNQEPVSVPQITFVVPNFELDFVAKQSSIPGGGLGCWMRFRYTGSDVDPPRKFTVEEGLMIDLGVYGPHRPEDRKSNLLGFFKNFIHNWEGQSYQYEVSRHERHTDTVIDICYDITGEVHEQARRSLLAYMNEICSAGDQADVHLITTLQAAFTTFWVITITTLVSGSSCGQTTAEAMNWLVAEKSIRVGRVSAAEDNGGGEKA